MSTPLLQTKNLKLVPHSPVALLALIEGPESYQKAFGWPAAEGLRGFLVSDDVSPEWLAKLKTATAADPWTHGFGLLHPASGKVIGFGSFIGPPDESGMVEIAYGIVPAYQRRGYATEGAQALVDYAVQSGQVKVIRAHTLPEPNASTRVLTKCGFQKIGEVVHPDDGLVWRWEKQIVKHLVP